MLATAAMSCSVHRLLAWHHLVVSVLARGAGLQLLLLRVAARSGGLGAENRVLGPEAYSWSNHSHRLGLEQQARPDLAYTGSSNFQPSLKSTVFSNIRLRVRIYTHVPASIAGWPGGQPKGPRSRRVQWR